jgi:hypothetical protein
MTLARSQGFEADDGVEVRTESALVQESENIYVFALALARTRMN